MNKPDYKVQLFILFLILIIMTPLFAGEGTNLKRYALFIGANDGGAERVYLRYAESDALSMASVMKNIGGVNSSDCRILLNPAEDELSRSLDEISEWVKTTKDDAKRIEFILYYSGHSDEYGLLLKGGSYPYMKLKDQINEVEADVHIAILDSCSSGSFTRLKGGQRQRPFLMDESVDTSGYAFLTSSSENEAAQESDEIEGSFFTHFLLTGLMGAADHTGNSQVSLNEAYSYASEQTLARTEQTLAGAQHPSYDMKLSGSGDLVLTDLRTASAGMSISEEIEGRLFIRDSSDKLLAEINKGTGESVTIALPPGYYTITLENESALSNTAVTIGFNQTQKLSSNQFRTQEREWTTIRGNNQPEVSEVYNREISDIQNELDGIVTDLEKLKRIPMELSFISDDSEDFLVEGFAAGFIDSVHSVEGIQMGMITSLSGYLDGIQLSYLFGSVENGVNGAQVAGIFNTNEGTTDGIQVSGVFNAAEGAMNGLQIGGVFNSQTEGFLEGLQIGGVFNEHSGGNLDGFQIGGVFNSHTGGTIDGFQLAGVFNTSVGIYDGMQIGGVFNTSKGNMGGSQIAGVGSFHSGETFNGGQVSGIINTVSGNLKGFQMAGVYNQSGDLQGVQTGVVNKAKDVRGTQIGLINISDSYTKGVPIGLINITRDGIHKISSWSDSVNNAYAGFQLGTQNVYTIFYGGTDLDNPGDEVAAAVGAGAHIDINALFIEGDLAAKHFFKPSEFFNSEYWIKENHFTSPTLRILAGFRISPFLSILGGMTIDAWFPDYMDGATFPMKEIEKVQTFNDWGIDVSYLPRWFLGVRF
ncbi:MAG: caspase family protein [Spirochaetales bacterium]|nr:caspase family protein [Spirochaetales bacterium]